MDAARKEHGSRERARSRACERGVGFHENSCRSFEASSSVRASHLAESESPGRPCNEAQVHAGQDSPFASPASRLLFSFPSHLLLLPPPSTLPPPLLPPSSSSSSSSAQRARHGRAPSPSPPLGFLGPLTPLLPFSKRREAEDSSQPSRLPPRTPSPPSSFPPSSFSHLLHRLSVLPRGSFSSPTLLF